MSGGPARGMRHRELDARELMDDPDCDADALQRTYRRFRIVNGAVSGWRGIYTRRIRPLLTRGRPATLLDIGFGGGDVPRAIAAWAAADGIPLQVTAIDPDPRAAAYAATLDPVPGLTFRAASSAELVEEGARFDIVTSNHLLHHLGPAELGTLLAECEQLAVSAVLHNDIERGRLAYGLYSAMAVPLAPGSFIRADGLLSIRRSFTRAELTDIAPPGWAVSRAMPFRLVLHHGGHGAR